MLQHHPNTETCNTLGQVYHLHLFIPFPADSIVVGNRHQFLSSCSERARTYCFGYFSPSFVFSDVIRCYCQIGITVPVSKTGNNYYFSLQIFDFFTLSLLDRSHIRLISIPFQVLFFFLLTLGSRYSLRFHLFSKTKIQFNSEMKVALVCSKL